MTTPALMSVSDAAALLDVHRTTVWRWIAAGHLTLVPLPGRTRRVRVADVAALAGLVGDGATPLASVTHLTHQPSTTGEN